MNTAINNRVLTSIFNTLSNAVNHNTTGLGTRASQSDLTTLSNAVNHATTGLSTRASQTALNTLSNTVNHATTGLANTHSVANSALAGLSNIQWNNIHGRPSIADLTGATGQRGFQWWPLLSNLTDLSIAPHVLVGDWLVNTSKIPLNILNQVQVEPGGVVSSVSLTSGSYVGNIAGPRGETGEQGKQGKDGEDGKQGEVGERGQAFTFADFTQEQLESLRGEQGKQGEQGQDGQDGADGKDGKDGENGIDGQDGKDGEIGEQGQRGTQWWLITEDIERLSEVPGAIIGDSFINISDTQLRVFDIAAGPGAIVQAIYTDTTIDNSTGIYKGTIKSDLSDINNSIQFLTTGISNNHQNTLQLQSNMEILSDAITGMHTYQLSLFTAVNAVISYLNTTGSLPPRPVTPPSAPPPVCMPCLPFPGYNT
jgi:hypothetical protein